MQQVKETIEITGLEPRETIEISDRISKELPIREESIVGPNSPLEVRRLRVENDGETKEIEIDVDPAVICPADLF